MAKKPEKPGSENEVRNAIRDAARLWGITLWRNNSGGMTDRYGHFMRFGLGNEPRKKEEEDDGASSDLIGIGPDGRFWAIETKKTGWKMRPSDERAQRQKKYIDYVNAHKGVAFFADRLEGAIAKFEEVYGKKRDKHVPPSVKDASAYVAGYDAGYKAGHDAAASAEFSFMEGSEGREPRG